MDRQMSTLQSGRIHEKRATQLRRWSVATRALGLMLTGCICAAVPSLAGHHLHAHFGTIGKYIIYLSMVTLVAFMWVGGITYTLWSCSKKRAENV